MCKMKTPTDPLQAGSATGAILYKLCDSPTVISQISYPDKVSSICPTSDGHAWLCQWNNNTVNLIDGKGQLFTNKAKVIQTIQHNSNITEISVDPTTDRLWFCCSNERTIHEVSTSSTPVTRFTTEGHPHRLCVTKEGRVVVGTMSTHGYEVVMCTADGRVLHTATIESGASVLSITQCGVTGNIAVASAYLMGGRRKKITVYNPTLQPLIHYHPEMIRDTRHEAREANTPDKLGPYTVIYDSKGNIVIADESRNTIELLSGAGKYINTLHTNKGPQGAVGIQKDDVLWSCLMLDTGMWELKLLKYYSH